MVFVYREFGCKRDPITDHVIGSTQADIRLYVDKNNTIYVQIISLHEGNTEDEEDEFEDDGIQAIMLIKYDPILHLYDIIKTVLDKITYDLRYKYSEDYNEKTFPYRDFIVKENYEVINLPCVWNFDKKRNAYNSEWMEFNRKNVEYLTIEEIKYPDKFYSSNFIIIRGEVKSSGEFVYDYPIVSTNVSIEYYNKTRAR